MPKNYRASTGVDEFFYAPIDEETNAASADPERVKFLQNITVEAPQTPVRAYGDNTTAEIAVASGNVTVTSTFHKIPREDINTLLGLETTEAGLSAYGSEDTPPYVAVVFAKTYEDGSREYVGLPKGIFLRPTVDGSTKSDTVEFDTDEISAEFMDRAVDGFEKEKSVLFGVDEPGSTAARDALFAAVFGEGAPADAPEEV